MHLRFNFSGNISEGNYLAREVQVLAFRLKQTVRHKWVGATGAFTLTLTPEQSKNLLFPLIRAHHHSRH